MKPNRDDILRRLHEHKAELTSEFPVHRLALFGSLARNGHSESSDIDLLVDVDPAERHLLRCRPDCPRSDSMKWVLGVTANHEEVFVPTHRNGNCFAVSTQALKSNENDWGQ